MYNVTSCPDKVDVLKRSKAINCTEKNPYMCLPNKDLTELLEICHHEPFRGSSPGEKTDATLLHNVHIFHGCLTSTIFILQCTCCLLICCFKTGLCPYLDTWNNFSIGFYGCEHFMKGCPTTWNEPLSCEFHKIEFSMVMRPSSVLRHAH